MDKDLKQLRNNRWETAFSGEIPESEDRAVNRKATIVIEHIIQASDIGHTMQVGCQITVSCLFETSFGSTLLVRSAMACLPQVERTVLL